MQTRQMKTFCKNCSFGRRNLHLVVVHEGIATARLTLFFPIQPCQVNGHQPRTKLTSNKFWSFCNTWNATCWGTSLKQSSVGSRMVFGDPKFHFPTSAWRAIMTELLKKSGLYCLSSSQYDSLTFTFSNGLTHSYKQEDNSILLHCWHTLGIEVLVISRPSSPPSLPSSSSSSSPSSLVSIINHESSWIIIHHHGSSSIIMSHHPSSNIDHNWSSFINSKIG